MRLITILCVAAPALVSFGCETSPPEASVTPPTAKAPADPRSVTPAEGLLDAHVPTELQTATFALG